MQNKEKVEKLVYDVIKDVNHSIIKNTGKDNFMDTPLLGNFDSLSMVTLIVALEETIKREFGKSISLANEDTDSVQSTPFKTIGTLIDYICLHLTEE